MAFQSACNNSLNRSACTNAIDTTTDIPNCLHYDAWTANNFVSCYQCGEGYVADATGRFCRQVTEEAMYQCRKFATQD